MSQATRQNEKTNTKRVFFEGTDTLSAGHLLCYNADATRAADANQDVTVKAATDQYDERAVRVEKPTSANLKNFAGVVTENFDSITGPRSIEIYVPTRRGQVINIFSSANATINTTALYLVADSFVAASSGSVRIGTAIQTIDRSTTNGIIQSTFTGPADLNAEVVSANSRTTVQLPTAAIWDNFPLQELRDNPFAGSLYEADFKRATDFPVNVFIDATYAAAAGGKTITEAIQLGITAIGELRLFSTTDNQASEFMVPCPIAVSGGNQWAFEIRVKQVNLTDTKAGWFVGLMLSSILVGNLVVDGGTLQTEGSLGFQKKEGDGDKYDFVYDETGQSQNEHDADYVTPVADTYNTLGMHFNGTTIQGYADGVALGTAISAVDIAAADFPTAKVFNPVIALKNAAADDFTLTLDWIRVAQLA